MVHTHCNGTVIPQEYIAGFQVPVAERESDQGGVETKVELAHIIKCMYIWVWGKCAGSAYGHM